MPDIIDDWISAFSKRYGLPPAARGELADWARSPRPPPLTTPVDHLTRSTAMGAPPGSRRAMK